MIMVVGAFRRVALMPLLWGTARVLRALAVRGLSTDGFGSSMGAALESSCTVDPCRTCRCASARVTLTACVNEPSGAGTQSTYRNATPPTSVQLRRFMLYAILVPFEWTVSVNCRTKLAATLSRRVETCARSKITAMLNASVAISLAARNHRLIECCPRSRASKACRYIFIIGWSLSASVKRACMLPTNTVGPRIARTGDRVREGLGVVILRLELPQSVLSVCAPCERRTLKTLLKL